MLSLILAWTLSAGAHGDNDLYFIGRWRQRCEDALTDSESGIPLAESAAVDVAELLFDVREEQVGDARYVYALRTPIPTELVITLFRKSLVLSHHVDPGPEFKLLSAMPEDLRQRTLELNRRVPILTPANFSQRWQAVLTAGQIDRVAITHVGQGRDGTVL